MAVMNVEKGEEIVGGWASVYIPQVGIYKLLAIKFLALPWVPPVTLCTH